jgi:PTH2 family peptidyl-tRNA hydrolase
MMIVMRRDLKMRKGKIAAQAGHAAVEAVLTALRREERFMDLCPSEDGFGLRTEGKNESPLTECFNKGCAKICVYVDSEEELLQIASKAEEKGIIAAVITDAGMTEFHGVPTKTCLALEPLPSDKADELTGGLPLY